MGILTAFILALLISFVFTGSGTRTVSSIIVFFLVLFLAGIASMFWIVPFGPVMWGVSWLPMLFFILIVAFLFSVPPTIRTVTKTNEKMDEAAGSLSAVSMFVWLLFCFFLIAIVVGYYRT